MNSQPRPVFGNFGRISRLLICGRPGGYSSAMLSISPAIFHYWVRITCHTLSKWNSLRTSLSCTISYSTVSFCLARVSLSWKCRWLLRRRLLARMSLLHLPQMGSRQLAALCSSSYKTSKDWHYKLRPLGNPKPVVRVLLLWHWKLLSGLWLIVYARAAETWQRYFWRRPPQPLNGGVAPSKLSIPSITSQQGSLMQKESIMSICTRLPKSLSNFPFFRWRCRHQQHQRQRLTTFWKFKRLIPFVLKWLLPQNVLL
eukprot:284815814_2